MTKVLGGVQIIQNPQNIVKKFDCTRSTIGNLTREVT